MSENATPYVVTAGDGLYEKSNGQIITCRSMPDPYLENAIRKMENSFSAEELQNNAQYSNLIGERNARALAAADAAADSSGGEGGEG